MCTLHQQHPPAEHALHTHSCWYSPNLRNTLLRPLRGILLQLFSRTRSLSLGEDAGEPWISFTHCSGEQVGRACSGVHSHVEDMSKSPSERGFMVSVQGSIIHMLIVNTTAMSYVNRQERWRLDLEEAI